MVQIAIEFPSELPLKRWIVEDYHRMIGAGILTPDDINQQQVIVLRDPQVNAYQSEQILSIEAQIATLAFPEVTINLKNLLL